MLERFFAYLETRITRAIVRGVENAEAELAARADAAEARLVDAPAGHLEELSPRQLNKNRQHSRRSAAR